MTQEELTQKTIEMISDKTGIMQSKINNDSRLISDLSLDSIDMVELEVALEKEFGVPVSITDDVIPVTIQDIIYHISKKLN